MSCMMCKAGKFDCKQTYKRLGRTCPGVDGVPDSERQSTSESTGEHIPPQFASASLRNTPPNAVRIPSQSVAQRSKPFSVSLSLSLSLCCSFSFSLSLSLSLSRLSVGRVSAFLVSRAGGTCSLLVRLSREPLFCLSRVSAGLGRTGGRTVGQADGRSDGRKDGRTDGRMFGRTVGGQRKGRSDGRADSRADGRTSKKKTVG